MFVFCLHVAFVSPEPKKYRKAPYLSFHGTVESKTEQNKNQTDDDEAHGFRMVGLIPQVLPGFTAQGFGHKGTG